MRPNFIKLVVIICITILYFSSCMQDETIFQKDVEPNSFFETKTINPFKDYAVKFLKNLDDSIHFTDEFINTFGLPKWDNGISNYNENTLVSTLIIPIVDGKYNELTSMYYFKEHNGWMNYYLILNDEDDLNYESSKYLIQYFEKYLKLTISNNEFDIKTKPNPTLKSNFIVYEVCYTWWQHDEWNGWRELTECSYEYTPIGGGSYDGGYNGGTAPSTGYIPGGGGGGTGGSGGDDKPLVLTDEVVPLTNEQQQIVNNKINDIKINDCIGAQVINYINNNNLSVASWGIKSESIGQGGYDPILGQITFISESAIQARTLAHELLHLAQEHYYQNKLSEIALSSDKKGYSNIEFEARIIDDFKSYGNASISDDMAINLDYMEFIYDMKINGIPFDFDSKFFNFIEHFKQFYPAYNKPTDPNLKPTFIKTLNPKCNNFF